MKKLILSALALLLSFTLLVVASYAWASTPHTGSYTSPALRTSLENNKPNYIYISQTPDSMGDSVFVANSAYGLSSMSPVTTTDMATWRWEDGTTLSSAEVSANVFRHTIYITSQVPYSAVKIKSITFTGTGATLPITSAIRVGLTTIGSGYSLMCSANTCSSSSLPINPMNAHMGINVCIWFEGTDPSCTYSAVGSCQDIIVSVELEGV